MTRSRLRIPEPLRALARMAHERGWRITRSGSGHLRWCPPQGRPVFTASTPGGGNRSIANTRARLRRAGLTEERT